MPEKNRGYYDKYTVTRNDTGETVAGPTFTLVVTRDPFAYDALRAYADACEDDNPTLAEELRELAEQAPDELDSNGEPIFYGE